MNDKVKKIHELSHQISDINFNVTPVWALHLPDGHCYKFILHSMQGIPWMWIWLIHWPKLSIKNGKFDKLVVPIMKKNWVSWQIIGIVNCKRGRGNYFALFHRTCSIMKYVFLVNRIANCFENEFNLRGKLRVCKFA